MGGLLDQLGWEFGPRAEARAVTGDPVLLCELLAGALLEAVEGIDGLVAPGRGQLGELRQLARLLEDARALLELLVWVREG